MNKEILKRNIEQVIMQPCNDKYPTRIVPNGLSEDGNHICVKCKPEDTMMTIWLKYNDGSEMDFVQEILDRMPEKYRDHLVTLKHSDWVYYSYVPVFDTDTQEMWDKELDTFYKAKQEWCDKYGCD
jgi:hypothetical protein